MCGAKFQDFRMNLIRSFALLLASAVVATPALVQDRRGEWVPLYKEE